MSDSAETALLFIELPQRHLGSLLEAIGNYTVANDVELLIRYGNTVPAVSSRTEADADAVSTEAVGTIAVPLPESDSLPAEIPLTTDQEQDPAPIQLFFTPKLMRTFGMWMNMRKYHNSEQVERLFTSGSRNPRLSPVLKHMEQRVAARQKKEPQPVNPLQPESPPLRPVRRARR